MSDVKLGLQLIVYGGRPRVDLAGVLAEVKGVGYDGVETGALYADEEGDSSVVDILRNSGLALTGVHAGYGDFTEEGIIADHIAFLQECDSKYLICSGVADNEHLAGYEESAETFNKVGRMCLDAGLVFCYHNHAWEFQPLEGGVKGIHRLLELTDPKLVKLCTDVYWVHIGHEQPAEFIAKYADRAGYYHFKDGDQGPTFVELGQGAVDLVAARAAVMAHPVDWVVCEQDSSQKDPHVSIKESFDYLKQIGF